MTHWHQWIFLVTSYKPKVNSGEISFISLRYWNLNTIYNLWTTNNILEMVESILTLWSGNGGLKCEQLVQGTHGEWQSPCGHTGPDTLPHAVLLIPENPSAHLIHMGPSQRKDNLLFCTCCCLISIGSQWCCSQQKHRFTLRSCPFRNGIILPWCSLTGKNHFHMGTSVCIWNWF